MGDIVSAALRYKGAGYVFGGVPADGIGSWDCSSFVNWVLGNDLGMGIPGYPAGSYHGQVHGPVVLDYATWSGASTHSGNPSPGDLCVWPGIGPTGHIGIATGNTQMISALNHSKGTVQTPIQGYGPAGVAVIFRSVSGNSSSGSSGGSSNLVGCTGLIGMVSYALLNRIERRRHCPSREYDYPQSPLETHYPSESRGADTGNGSSRQRRGFLARQKGQEV